VIAQAGRQAGVDRIDDDEVPDGDLLPARSPDAQLTLLLAQRLTARLAALAKAADSGWLDPDLAALCAALLFSRDAPPGLRDRPFLPGLVGGGAAEDGLAFGTGGPAAEFTRAGALSFSCSDIFGHDGGNWVGSIAGFLGSDGNICLDPHFHGPGIRGAGSGSRHARRRSQS